MDRVRIVLRLVLATTMIVSTGCHLCSRRIPLPPIENPVPDLTEVSVIPVGADTLGASENWTGRLRTALLRVHGIDRVHRVTEPDLVDEEMDDPMRLMEVRQCLLEVNVLDFDAYFPPRALVAVNFYLPPGSRGTIWDPLTLDQHGSPPQGSRSVSDRGPWIRFEKSYRTDDEDVMRALRKYAESAGDEDRGFDPVDRILRVSDRFIDFVLYETLKECFSRIDGKEEESDGELSQLLDGGPRG